VRASAALVLASLFLCRAAFGQPFEGQGSVKLNDFCEKPGRSGCIVQLSIEGPITEETARSFASLLELEQKRSGAALRPVVTIQSTGGDLYAAMAIGREIRKRTGAIVSTGPCYSACVFAAMGAVERNIAGIGLHRPYFAQSEANVFSEADLRYKRMLRRISEYLFEMNIAEDLLRLMVAIPPGEMRLLTVVDARRIGLNGVDPAFDEFRTGQEAAQYGVSSAELRRRHGSLDAQCGREEAMRSLADVRKRDDCRAASRERVLWDFDEETFARLTKSTVERCHATVPDSQDRRACVRRIAESIRNVAPKR
jgi:hypothetical protein